MAGNSCLWLFYTVDDHITVGPFLSYSFLVDRELEDAVEAAGSDEDPKFFGATLQVSF